MPCKGCDNKIDMKAEFWRFDYCDLCGAMYCSDCGKKYIIHKAKGRICGDCDLKIRKIYELGS